MMIIRLFAKGKGVCMCFVIGKSVNRSPLIFCTIFSLLLLVPVSTAFCSGLKSFKGTRGSLLIAGGTAHLPVMSELARRIHESNPQVNISVSGGGSSAGIEKVGENIVDIGNSGRLLTKDEAAAYALTSIPFAIDGIAVVVHPTNKVSSLSSEQVRKIFIGEIRNWREVGGENEEIHLYGRKLGSATRKVFREKILGADDFAANSKVVDANNAMKVIVSWDLQAIGYLSIGHLDATKVKAVILDGIIPNQANSTNSSYKISRQLYMYISETPTALTRLFVNYVLGSEGHDAIVAAGYIPLH